jgi:hypothetical protein
MSELENPHEIESIVRAKRHPTKHLGRLVSDDETIYILHSAECVAAPADLRECRFSQALDRGASPRWEEFRDRAVTLGLGVRREAPWELTGLVPLRPAPKRWWSKAPAQIRASTLTPGAWSWHCLIDSDRLGGHAFSGHGLEPSHAAALAALGQHQREQHPGRAALALVAARFHRTRVAQQALYESRLLDVPAVREALGVTASLASHDEVAMLLVNDAGAMAAVQSLTRSSKEA